MTQPPKYPSAFFVAHGLYIGPAFPPGGQWGDLLDGPVESEREALDIISDRLLGGGIEEVRVWRIKFGIAYDVTSWVMASLARQVKCVGGGGSGGYIRISGLKSATIKRPGA